MPEPDGTDAVDAGGPHASGQRPEPDGGLPPAQGLGADELASALGPTRCEFRTAQELVLTPLRVDLGRILPERWRPSVADLPLPERPKSGMRVRMELPAGAIGWPSSGSTPCASISAASPTSPCNCTSCSPARASAFSPAPRRPRSREHPPVPAADQRSRRWLQRRPFDAARDAARPRACGSCRSTSPSRSASCSSTSPRWRPPWRRRRQRPGAGVPVQAPCPRARRVGRARQFPAALRSGHQPVRAARRTARAQRHVECLPPRARADGAGRLRGLRHPVAACLRRRQQRAGVRSFRCSRPSTAPGSGGYFCAEREPRPAQRPLAKEGPRSGYVGSEVFVSLVDPQHAPWRRDLRQLAARVRVTNRDLPLFIPLGDVDAHLTLTRNAPVESIRVIAGPSRPIAAPRDGRWPGACSACCRSAT